MQGPPLATAWGYRTSERSVKMDGQSNPPARSASMSVAVSELDQIESKVLSLPRAERIRILEALSASLDIDPEIERAWNDEVLRRLAEVRAGKAEMIEGEDFDRELAE